MAVFHNRTEIVKLLIGYMAGVNQGYLMMAAKRAALIAVSGYDNDEIRMLLSNLVNVNNIGELIINYTDTQFYINYHVVCDILVEIKPLAVSYIYMFHDDVEHFDALWEIIADNETVVVKRYVLDTLFQAIMLERMTILNHIILIIVKKEIVINEQNVEIIRNYCYNNRNSAILQIILDSFPYIKNYTCFRRYKNTLRSIIKENQYSLLITS
jgi:hypothetical protein